MEITYLADHLEYLPILAAWHHGEWGYIRPGDTVEARQLRLGKECGHGEVPTTVIALENGTLLGSAMLIESDMETRKELSPWLASVFVAPESRRRGIGAALVQRIIHEARALGFPRLYLYTPSEEQFYASRGWSVLERRQYAGKEATVMAFPL